MAPDLRLHDEYFLLAHDDYTGRAHINATVLGAGLAGALLADLVITGCVELVDGTVRISAGAVAPDTVSRGAVTVIGRRAHPVGWWVEYLRSSAYLLTGEQLTERGLVIPARSGLFRTAIRYVATDALVAAGPRVRLRHLAETGTAGPPDQRMVTLAALALATGLEGIVADAANRPVREGLRSMANDVPTELRRITAAVDAAVMRLAMATPRGR
jgi:hypothetical protein